MKIEEKQNLLWKSADAMRGTMEIAQIVDTESIILTHMYIEANSELADQMPKKLLWSNITRGGGSFKEKIKNASVTAEKKFSFLKDVFNNIEIPNQVDDNGLYQLINTFQPFNTLNVNEFAELFETLLYKFGEAEGKAGGEYLTPAPLAKLLSQLLDIRSGDVNDGVAGINQFLVEANRNAEENGGHVNLYGQEINARTWALGKIYLFMSRLTNATVTLSDTLLNPPLTNDGVLQKFDFVLMDPPYSMRWDPEQIKEENLGRFTYGLPSKSKSDMAFISHVVASLKEKGKAAIILPHGVLFRGGADGKIREEIIRDDLIEGVIGLPANLTYRTSIPVVVLILNKNKSKERKNKILFINANNEYTPGKGRNTLEKKHVDKIVKMFRSGEENEEACCFASTKEILENDANLNISRYFTMNEVQGKFGQVKVDLEKFEKSATPKKYLFEIAETFRGMNTPSLTKITNTKDGYPVIQLVDVQDGEIKFDQLSMMPIDEPSKIQNFLVQEGDIIVSNRGNAIKIAIVPRIDKKIILSHNFHAIRPREGMNAQFIKAYLESPVGQSYIESMQKGTAIKVLTLKEFNYLIVPVLPAEQQEVIGDTAEKAEKEYRKTLKQATEKRKKIYEDCFDKMGISRAIYES
ncbi:N-6 DNA methylase [Sporolactobacillus kofuensis]|uniref:site-specific DNA-methyltransferase (adenine-specific) n=1 Tax=Sporolactobacillus kofuensis TaxID=269672 RepID=A0ABW1WG31_9BACL|nr:N-6 DNA methylase [Sporolactobacillus kofuensis]MCO7176982.1 N-6 DNA methylase [Sporolactobacillus kofuensis]